jgi:predicted nucleic-acid-binding Zn-ribbon protein
MRSITYILQSCVFAGALILSVSCTPGSCFEETNAYLKASFYLDSTGKLKAPDSLTLYGIGRDTARYKKASGIQPALIPLNASAEKCGFIIRINGVSDTLSFWYTSYPHLISKECGYTFYYKLDSVYTTRNIIDTILIEQRTVAILNEPNILIYY